MNKVWRDDGALFDMVRRELFSAVIGDVMDRMQLTTQFLPPAIHPLHPDMVVIGRAMPVLEADFFAERVQDSPNTLSAKPFGLMMEALDGLRPGEVYVCTGASPEYALWGELMSVRAKICGAAGGVLDGFSRDTKGIRETGFPVFSMGPYAQDQGPRGKVVDHRVPIRIGQVRIDPGDIVFGDFDGTCVVPSAATADVLAAALEKVRGEKTVRKALEAGMPAKEAFEKFGIL